MRDLTVEIANGVGCARGMAKVYSGSPPSNQVQVGASNVDAGGVDTLAYFLGQSAIQIHIFICAIRDTCNPCASFRR